MLCRKYGNDSLVLLFRFFAVYFILISLPFPIGYLSFTSAISKWYFSVYDRIVIFAGRTIFQVTVQDPVVYTGSGDRLYDYVSACLLLVVAAIVTIVYSRWIKNKPAVSRQMAFWGLLYLRYRLCWVMLRYGFEKVLKVQFPFQYTSLNETYGESSPMRLLWTFMGYSTTYNVFAGLAEVLAGLLLMFRKTATLGALMCMAIMTNVVLLNFTYDVPVKLYATHVLALSVFLLLPDAGRLLNFFILNRPVQAVQYFIPRSISTHPRWASVCKFFFFSVLLFYSAEIVWTKYQFFGDAAYKRTTLFGIYEVETFVRNNDTIIVSAQNDNRWKRINILLPNKITIEYMNGSVNQYASTIDTQHHHIKIALDANKGNQKTILQYAKPAPDKLVITGKVSGDSVYILTKQQDLHQLRLMNRGFHWISETPYNQ